MTNTLTSEQMEEYRIAIFHGRILPVLAQLGSSLREYKSGIEPFAQKLDQDDSSQTPDGLAELFGQFYPPEFSLGAADKWMSLTNTTI